jgi:hypothetical protein
LNHKFGLVPWNIMPTLRGQKPIAKPPLRGNQLGPTDVEGVG